MRLEGGGHDDQPACRGSQNNSDKQGEGGEAGTSCAGLHARPKDWTATSKQKEVKLKHCVLVSTPDQRTGPFRINVLLAQCYLLHARGISAHFAYTSNTYSTQFSHGVP